MTEAETTSPSPQLLVSSKFLCDRYGVVRSTLHDWAKKQPSLKAPNGEFILSECDLYVIESLRQKLNTTKVNTKDRLTIAQAEKIELENRIKEFDFSSRLAEIEEENEKQQQRIVDTKIAEDARSELLELLKDDTPKLSIVLARISDPSILQERLENYLAAIEEDGYDPDLDDEDDEEFEETSNLGLSHLGLGFSRK